MLNKMHNLRTSYETEKRKIFAKNRKLKPDDNLGNLEGKVLHIYNMHYINYAGIWFTILVTDVFLKVQIYLVD